MNVYGIIPARLASTRLPRKLLLAETGHPVIEYTWRAASRAKSLKQVIVAADSDVVVGCHMVRAGPHALLLAPQAGRPLPMGLQNGLQQWQGLWASHFGANSVELLVRMALAGAGLVAVDERFVRPHLAAGTLLPVLPFLPAAPL